MEVLKFNENIKITDRSFYEHGKSIHNRTIIYYNSLGYKLYYYKNFDLIEITSVRKNSIWKKEWGKLIFFLNDAEYNDVIKMNMKCKELYDMHLKQAELEAEMPISYIYYDILKKE